jgi:hypothetical protein
MDPNHIHVCNITVCDYHNLDEKINERIACVIACWWHLIHNQVVLQLYLQLIQLYIYD